MTIKCLSCGTAEWLHDIRDLSYPYKGERTVIEAVAGEFGVSQTGQRSHCQP